MGRVKVRALAIELTAACNQKCDYCYNAWREDGGAGVATGGPSKLLARLARTFDALEVEEVTLTGGEPLSRPDLFDVIAFVRARGARVKIISNGGLVTQELAGRLAGAGIGFVQVTLNGPNAALHHEHVGGDGHFEPTLEGIRLLRGAGVPVVGCIVLTRKNAALTSEILRLFRALDVRRISLSRFSPAGYAARHAARLLPSRTELLVAFEHAARAVREDGFQCYVAMPVPPCALEIERFPELAFGTCPIGTEAQELALGPDGKLRHCTLHGASLGGDVLDPTVDVAAILGSSAITEYRRELPEFCQGCLHAATCGGGCGAAAAWVFGSRRFVDPFVAQHVDEEFAARLERERDDEKHRLPIVA